MVFSGEIRYFLMNLNIGRCCFITGSNLPHYRVDLQNGYLSNKYDASICAPPRLNIALLFVQNHDEFCTKMCESQL